MARLNQIIAVEKGIKSRVYAAISEMHKALQKPELFKGFVRVYQKRDEDGEDLPPERKRVQFVVTDVLTATERLLSELMNVTARKDWTNCSAMADIVVDGQVLIPAVPVTYLLFLEKQLTDIRTFVGQLPILDEGEDWTFDGNSGLHRTAATQTTRSRKVQRPLVLYPATPEHPAQTQIVSEDVLAGVWNQTKQSGAFPKTAKEGMAGRVEKLLQAVKQAREEANGVEERGSPDVGTVLFKYLREE